MFGPGSAGCGRTWTFQTKPSWACEGFMFGSSLTEGLVWLEQTRFPPSARSHLQKPRFNERGLTLAAECGRSHLWSHLDPHSAPWLLFRSPVLLFILKSSSCWLDPSSWSRKEASKPSFLPLWLICRCYLCCNPAWPMGGWLSAAVTLGGGV